VVIASRGQPDGVDSTWAVTCALCGGPAKDTQVHADDGWSEAAASLVTIRTCLNPHEHADGVVGRACVKCARNLCDLLVNVVRCHREAPLPGPAMSSTPHRD